MYIKYNLFTFVVCIDFNNNLNHCILYKFVILSMARFILRVFCALLLFFNVDLIRAELPPLLYYYTPLGIADGLSSSRIQCISNDYKGYLWIGTESGINCYDRNNLKQYFHNPKDELTLPSSEITFITEDSLRNLWVGTTNGISRYNRTRDRFEPIIENGVNLYVASYLLIDGGVLFCAAGFIYKYEYATRQLRTLYTTKDPNRYITFDRILSYDKNRILINTKWHGVYFYHLDTNQLKQIEYLSDKNYSACFIDTDKRIWISSYGNGLFCYENGKIIHHFTSSNSKLTYDVIHDIIEKDSTLWIATDGGGINMLSLDNLEFTNIQHVPDDMHSFPTNTIYRLYKDPMNNIWAGSIRSGLIGIKKVYAQSFQNVPFGNRHGLSDKTINAFYQDNDGLIWIGTDGGGLNSFNPTTATFNHYPTTKYQKITCITEYSAEELLFHSFNKGLFIFNKITGVMRPFILIDQEINARTCINGFSVNVKKIAENKILFAADNVYIYDIVKKKFTVAAVMGTDFKRNSPLIITTVGNKTYIADLKNICEYDVSTEQFRTIYKGEHLINDVCMDNAGIFWIASAAGLISYNPISGIAHYIESNLFNEVTSIIADNQNRVWIGTRQDLYVYATKTKCFMTLDAPDGVLPNEYFFHTMLISKQGNILIGGTMGLTTVSDDIQFDTDIEHTIELLDVLLNGLPLLEEELLNLPRTIHVPWDFSSLQLKVLLNEQDVFRKRKFKFNINNSNNELIQSISNSVMVNHLSIGEYTVTASYYTKNGNWSDAQEIIHIVVSPPWWETNWAYTLFSFICILVVYCVIYFIHKKKKAKQQRELERMKDQLYEEKISFLTNISHELRTPLTLVCAPLKRIIAHEIPQEDVYVQLESIYKQAYQMKNIIDMVLYVRKIEEGKEILHITNQCLNEWVCSVGNDFIREFEAKGIMLKYELDDEINKVSFDKQQCEFVLSNFLMNALKFSDLNTQTTIITALSADRKKVLVSVKDQGIGLNKADIASLFTCFYQGDHDKGGSGIGLFYCKNLITHHHGEIGVVENADKGATFYYELPLQISEHDHVEQPKDEIFIPLKSEELLQLDYSYLKGFSVVIVEDTLDLRNYLKETLSNYFANIYVAQDGKEGLELIKNKLPDFIISDVMMPKMNGFDLCREVKTDLSISHVPVILLTAYHNSQNMYTGYKIGADAFLPKPFEVDGLLALIYNQLKLRDKIKTRYRDDKTLTYQEISFSNADETFLLKLNTLIVDNISNSELDVAFISTNMHISRSLLFNKVKSLTGMGIINYVNIQRIEHAVTLLTTTSMNVTEISEAVGFSSLRYFSKVFKSIKGTIPSKYNKDIES